MKKLIIIALVCLGCSPAFNGKNYVVVQSIVLSGDFTTRFKVNLLVVTDSLYTNDIYKVGDTIYFNKIRIR